MQNFFMLRLLAMPIGIVLSAQPQLAGVIYSNLGPGDSFSASVASGTVACPPPGGGPCPANLGQAFTPGIAYFLDTIEIAGTTSSFPSLSLSLMTSVGGLPGSVIETLTIAQGSAKILTGSSVAHPLLNAGTQYWVTSGFFPLSSWNLNSVGDNGNRATQVFTQQGSTPWTSVTDTQLALRVSGTSATLVPEPAFGVATFLSLIAFAALKRRTFS